MKQRNKMVYSRLISTSSLLLLFIASSGCTYQGEPVEGKNISLSFENLNPLSKGHFKGWVVFRGEKISFGKFNILEDGTLIDPEGRNIDSFMSGRDLKDADEIVITIEPDSDTDPNPSGVVLLRGDIKSKAIKLSFREVDLTKASGKFIMATPTDGYPSNEKSGVQFLYPPGARQRGPAQALFFPDAPPGWKYEGWVIYNGTAITTGRFKSPSKPDEFNGYGLQGGENPPFPGEDFLFNPPEGLDFPLMLDGGSGAVAITLEPDIDGNDPTGEDPFQLKFLSRIIPKGAMDHFNLPMELNLTVFPSGVAKIG